MRRWAVVVGILGVGCGPEQVPVDTAESSEGGTSVADVSPTSGGSEATPTSEGSGGGTSSSGGTSTGETGGTEESSTGEPPPPPPELPEPCALVLAEGDVRLPIDATFVGGGLRMTALEPGAPDVPARVITIQDEGIGDMHSNYRARSFVLESWPDGVDETSSSRSLTRNGHALSRMVRLPGEGTRFGYVWTGDPKSLNNYDTFFSVFDVDTWMVGGEVELDASSNSGFVDLLMAGSQERLLATYTTHSYDDVPDGTISGFSLGVLDTAGTPLIEGTPLTATVPLPGSDMRTFWAGDRVAAALAHNLCDGVDPLCTPHSVVLARPTAPDGHGVAVDGFEVTDVFEGLPISAHVERPQITVMFGLTWVLWFEAENSDASVEQRTFRGVVLGEGGDPIPWPPAEPAGGPVAFLAKTPMEYWPVMTVSELGVTVGFKATNTTFAIHHFDFSFKPLGEPIVIELDSSLPDWPAMAALAHPRSLLLTWAEEEEPQVKNVMRMVRLECAGG